MEAIRYFSDPMICLETVAKAKWPNGPECPRCQSKKLAFIQSRRLWTCLSCRKQFSVKVGTTVKWTNNDNVSHDVTSQNNLFFSGNLDPGATYTHTFQSAGSFPYYCTIHPLMVGTITVQ